MTIRKKIGLKAGLMASAAAIIASAAPGIAMAATANSNQIDTIVVTANRRAENILKVPIAVTAITAKQAEVHGVTDPQSLAAAIPGLTFNRQAATSMPFLRGVGAPVGQIGDEPSVAYYVDDVYIPSGAASLANFNDVDRLEVEKGPQGTLFGRNATGGVIQVFTKNPTPTPYIDAQIGYANYNTRSGSIYATSQLVKNLSANISLYGGQQLSGWGKNLTTGASAFTGWDNGGRIKFLWTPSDDTSVLLAVDRDTTKTSEGLFRPDYGTVGAGGLFGAPAGYYDLIDHTSPDPYAILRQSGVSLKVDQDFQWAKLVSVSAYRRTTEAQYFEESGGPVPLFNVAISDAPSTTLTQELQLQSEANSTLTWIAGFFYMHDKSGYSPITFSGLALAPLPYASSYGLETTDSYSGFGQVTATVLPDTHATVGLRYTIDDKSLTADYNLGGIGSGQNVGSPQSKQWTKVTYRFTLDHQFTDDTMGYVSYNRGFKSGTFNTIVGPGANITNVAPVAPEVLDDYSIGAKSELFDHRLRLSVEGFYYQYKDIQVNQILGGFSVLTNAAAATIKGIDFDFTARPIERLTLSGGVEVLNGHYDNYPNGLLWTYSPGGLCGAGSSNCTISSPNLAGNDTIETPPFSFSLNADYRIPTEYGPVSLDAEFNHTGNYYADPDNGHGQLNASLDKQHIENLLNLSVGWVSENGRWNARLWGKNVTSQKYWSFGTEDAFATQFAPAPPATYGVTLGMHFE